MNQSFSKTPAVLVMTKKAADGTVPRQETASAVVTTSSSSSSSSSSSAPGAVGAVASEDFGEYPADDICLVFDLPRGVLLGAPLARLLGSLIRVRDGSILQAKHDLLFWIRPDGSLLSLAAFSLLNSFDFLTRFSGVAGIRTVMGSGATGSIDSQLPTMRRALFALLVRGAVTSPVQVTFSAASDWGAVFPADTVIPPGAILAIAAALPVPPLAPSPLASGPAAGHVGGRRRSAADLAGRTDSPLPNRVEPSPASAGGSGAAPGANVVDLACDEDMEAEEGGGDDDSRSRSSTASQVMGVFCRGGGVFFGLWFCLLAGVC